MVVKISETMMPDHGSTPLYHQLKNIIQSEILSDEFAEDLYIKPKTPSLINLGDHCHVLIREGTKKWKNQRESRISQ